MGVFFIQSRAILGTYVARTNGRADRGEVGKKEWSNNNSNSNSNRNNNHNNNNKVKKKRQKRKSLSLSA